MVAETFSYNLNAVEKHGIL